MFKQSAHILPFALAILWCTLMAQDLRGQHLHHRRFTVDDGLPSNSLHGLFRDSRGFLWIATTSGLARFDGRRFESYSETDGMSGNEVLSVFEDSKGRIWLNTFNSRPGFFLDGRFYSGENEPQLRKPFAEYILHAAFEAKNGDIWGGTMGKGFTRLSPDLRARTRKDSIAGFRLMYVAEFSGRVYYFTHGGVFWDSGGKWQQVAPAGAFDGNYLLSYACRLADGLLWFANAQKALLIFDFEAMRWRMQDEYGLGEFHNLRLFGSELWLLDAEGIRILDGFDTAAFTWRSERRLALPHSPVDLVRNPDGSFWFATAGEGLYFVFGETVRATTGFGGGNRHVTAVAAHPAGGFWYGLAAGFIGTADPLRGITAEPVPENYGRLRKINRQGDLTTFIFRRATLLDRPSERRHISWGFRELKMLDDGRYIAGHATWRTFSCSEAELLAFSTARTGADTQRVYFGDGAFRILPAGDTLWLGFRDGLRAVHSGRLVDYTAPPWQINSAVTGIVADRAGKIWISTLGKGVFRFAEGEFRRITTADGLPGEVCNGLRVLGDTVYVATNRGLGVLWEDQTGMDGRIFTSESGLLSNEVNDVAVSGDWIACATPAGLTYLHRDRLRKPPLPEGPRIRFVRNRELFGPAPDRLVLPHDSNEVAIGLWACVPGPATGLRYRYRLQAGAAWTADDDGRIDFPALGPGTYAFEAQASLDGKNWTASGAKMRIEIRPPFWQSVWFVSLCGAVIALAGGGFAFGIARAGRKRERQKAVLVQRMQAAEQQAMLAQMNPHFIFNSLNSIQNYVLQNNTEAAAHFLERFGRLIRQILLNSRQRFVSLADEIGTLELYLELESMRFRNRLRYRIEAAPGTAVHKVRIPPMLIQPFVENAVWHGLMPRESGGELKVSFEKEGAKLKCVVEDNGIGRAAAKNLRKNRPVRGTGSGIQLSRDRLKLMAGGNPGVEHVEIEDLHAENGAAAGTRVTIRIPIYKIHASD